MVSEPHNSVILDNKDFEKFFSLLVEKYTIFAPSQEDEGYTFAKIDAPQSLDLHHTNTNLQIKDFFFPQTETLFAFDKNLKATKREEDEGKEQTKCRILFGVRPCDATAVYFLDKVFQTNSPPDPYYVKKRSVTRIISLACTDPFSTCFCTSVGCGPDSEKGSDIIFFELDGRYLIKQITAEGKEILAGVQELLRPVTDKDIEDKDRSMVAARHKLRKIFEVSEFVKRLDDFEAPYWERLHEKCLGCGVCTYMCPTCHCFDMTDEMTQSGGRRIRTWDSCMFPLFTQHASGHNPRPTQKERMRQRIMHKFSYAPKLFDEIFCVGCGKCVVHCPVNLDIRSIIQQIMEEQ